MELHDLKEHLDTRLDRLESKLDMHADRITRAETDVNWVKGSIKAALTFVITVAGSIVVWLLTGSTK